MGKSKKRGGEKAHRKRVAARNEQMKGLWQKQVNMAYEKHEEWKASKTGQTKTEEIKFDIK
jgi:hypothetical protein